MASSNVSYGLMADLSLKKVHSRNIQSYYMTALQTLIWNEKGGEPLKPIKKDLQAMIFLAHSRTNSQRRMLDTE